MARTVAAGITTPTITSHQDLGGHRRAVSAPARTVKRMPSLRRLALYATPLVAAATVSVVTVLVAAPDRATRPAPAPVPSATPTPSSDFTTVYPNLGALGAPLNLPPVTVDIPALVGKQTNSGMVTGLLWISGTPVDVSTGVFENDTQRALFDRVAACFPDRATDPSPEELHAATRTCFDPLVIGMAADEPDPSDVFMALRGLSLARPDVFTLCHNASHKVGELALRRLFEHQGVNFEGMRRLLLTGAIACQGGLVHGVYDAFGYMGLSVEEFGPAVAACEAMPQISGQCADAVGHASWDAFGDLPKSIETCGFWSTHALQQTCAEGIVMRVYQRLEPTDSFYSGTAFGRDADRFMFETAKMCLDWPSGPVPGILAADPRTLCYESIPYLLVKPLFALVQTNGAEYEPVRDETARLVEVLEAACATYGTYEDLCTGRVGHYMLGATVFDQAAAEDLCGLLERVAEHCRSLVRIRMERTEAGLG